MPDDYYRITGVHGGDGMLLIAVCDDEASDRIQLCDAINNYLQDRHIAGKVLIYENAETLIAATEEKKGRFDVVFLTSS